MKKRDPLVYGVLTHPEHREVPNFNDFQIFPLNFFIIKLLESYIVHSISYIFKINNHVNQRQ
jgi:hypothetical protein